MEEKDKIEPGISSPTYEELLADNEKLKSANEHLHDMMPSMEFSNTIEGPPTSPKQMWKQATSGDEVTTNAWEKDWIAQTEINIKEFDILNNPVLSEHRKEKYKPCIIAGSGPSLRLNVDELAANKGDISLTSCLHNYGFFEDKGIRADYYVNLDAGDITIGEMSQGGSKSDQYYWDSTKDKVLVTGCVGHPEIHRRWQGEIKWFCPPMPTRDLGEKIFKILGGKLVVYNVGGNSLGACMYHARAILGGNPIVFVGADFSFSSGRKMFHPFATPYDQQFAGVNTCTDIRGHRTYTWPSYYNFKVWFDFIACGGMGGNVGTQWVNCTEGGILGAYPEGNIKQIKQMRLADFLHGYNMSDKLLDEINKQDDPVLLF